MSERENSFENSGESPRREGDHYYEDRSYRSTNDGYHTDYHAGHQAYASESYYNDAPRYDARHDDNPPVHHDDAYTSRQEFSDRPVNTERAMYPGADNYYQEDRTDPYFSQTNNPPQRFLQDNPEVEPVWIKESQSRISYNDHDLRDVMKPQFSNMRTTLAGFAGTLAMLGLIGFLALSSAPDLSPEDIIAMQGYAGEQPIKTPFNLASLRECKDPADCPASDLSTTNLANTDGASNSDTGITNYAQATTTSQSTPNLNPIPKSAIADNLELQEIPATANTDVYLDSDLEPVSYDSTQAQSTSQQQIYLQEQGSQLRVIQQWSNVREEPRATGEILTSLAIGADVTILSQQGPWYEVSVNDSKQTIGYMHSSTVETK